MTAQLRFAQEENHFDREFVFGWPARGETARSVADRVLKTADLLSAVEPIWADVRPVLASRPFRSGDPGFVREMSPEALGELIDRKGRPDPPKAPKPVSRWGYSISFHTNRPGVDPMSSGMTVHAGDTVENSANMVRLGFPLASPIWRDQDMAVSVMQAGIAAWDAEWAWARAFISIFDGPYWRRPWMTWFRQPQRPPPSLVMEYPADYPPEFDLRPHETTEKWGGVLKIWP
ncbi:hypothetical protein [Phenylobacterium sp.]|uniref:hypothetical protein n=1 Tax=Phenylobacterium sp. TaxID=1871053 RepID=UPI002C92BB53|nr:hypothetical protein [Phenylobacterium sp.]HVI32548.1 hypothetical protein [Phenylobacterium sp.]